MSYKTFATINIITSIIYLFGVVFSILSLVSFFEIPLPPAVIDIYNISELYCIQPLYILFEDYMGLSIGIVGQYAIYFSIFILFLFTFIFSIAIAFRQFMGQRAGTMTIFLQILHIINIIYALFVIIVYLSIEVFILQMLIPTLIIIFISLLAFIINLSVQKRSF